jgi:hypothetical protein
MDWSDQPLIATSEPLAGQPSVWGGGAAIWGESYLGSKALDTSTEILVWRGPATAPEVLGSVKGSVTRFDMSPDGTKLAISSTLPSVRGSFKPSDPASLVVMKTSDGTMRELAVSDPTFRVGMVASPLWSPDSSSLLVFGATTERGPKPTWIRRALQISDDSVLGDIKTSMTPVVWRDEIVFREFVKGRENAAHDTFFAWSPGANELQPLSDFTDTSIDGEFSVRWSPKGARIEATNGAAFQLIPQTKREKASLEWFRRARTWAGPHRWLMQPDDSVWTVLDLDNPILRPLVAGPARSVDASPASPYIVLHGKGGRRDWAKLV